jgi:hypothetical protein
MFGIDTTVNIVRAIAPARKRTAPAPLTAITAECAFQVGNVLEVYIPKRGYKGQQPPDYSQGAWRGYPAGVRGQQPPVRALNPNSIKSGKVN